MVFECMECERCGKAKDGGSCRFKNNGSQTESRYPSVVPQEGSSRAEDLKRKRRGFLVDCPTSGNVDDY
ncbi:MAG: hypothetical protein ABIH48_02240 [Candidatus Falkowbacteria bacterium]